MAPIILPSNQPKDRFYKGGAQIDALRSAGPSDEFQPEDWVASTTCCNGCADSKVGMTRLPDGRLLADAIASEPEYWLGKEHMAKYGVDTKLLFKLLDAGQRLPVHAHPHVDWARKHLDRKHGKAEAWYMLTGGHIHLGLKEDIPMDQLLKWVEEQNVEALLSRMHKIPVQPHQTVYVPPGMLHAIGEGILIVELQEPEDLSVLLEWKGFAIDGEKDGHLGLGFETALTAVESTARSPEEMQRLVSGPTKSGPTVAEPSREYFRLDRSAIEGKETLEAGFAIMVVLDGEMAMKTAEGSAMVLKKGSTIISPHGDGQMTLTGKGDVLIARPPV
ncbi:mannose-6-phosphate isomerase [Sarocladium implicatum]|nr:mannose-6-phosphate isomerase [Sarocladium implicatum]